MIEVYVDERQTERLLNILYGVPGAAEKAVNKGLRAGAEAYRITTRKEDEKIYAISSKNLSSGGKANIRYYDTAAVITYSGNKVPLFKFTATPRWPVARALVWGQQLSIGAGGKFPHAFVQRMPDTGHVGIFERDTASGQYDGRRPIREIMGVASAQMAWRTDVREKAEMAAREKTKAAFGEAISEALNKT